MWGRGGGLICSVVGTVDHIQNVISSCWEINMLVAFWKDGLKIIMIKISSEDDESIWVCCLLFTDGLIQFKKCRIPVNADGGWSDVYRD